MAFHTLEIEVGNAEELQKDEIRTCEQYRGERPNERSTDERRKDVLPKLRENQ